jgi:hypothetical protein
MSTPIFFTVKFSNTTVINMSSEEVSFRGPGTVAANRAAVLDGYSGSLDTQREFYMWQAEAEIPLNYVCAITGLRPDGGEMICYPIGENTSQGTTEHHFFRADPKLRDA